YGIGFFIATILPQYILHKLRRDGNKGKTPLWVGTSAIIILCVCGLIMKNVAYLAAVIGFR
ncbi:MAG: hypothetical protein K1W06_11775, partial [Lachnospiraceae bacterium]